MANYLQLLYLKRLSVYKLRNVDIIWNEYSYRQLVGWQRLGKTEVGKKHKSQCHRSTTNTKWTAARLNSGLHREGPATKCLSHAMVQDEWYYANTLCGLFKENALSQTPVGGSWICTRRIPFNSLCWEPLIWVGMAVSQCSVMVSN